MPVEYPVVIAAIKEWIGKHKTMPDPGVEIGDQPAVRKASGSEMLSAAFKELGTLAVTGGFNFATGGTEGFNKFFDSLPPALKEPLGALKDTFGNLTSSIPGSGTFTDALSSIKENFINPIGDSLTSFKTAVLGDSSSLTSLAQTYETTDPSVSSWLTSASTTLGTTVKNAIDSAKSWSDNLSLGGTYVNGVWEPSSFTLTDAISATNNAGRDFLSKYAGITEAPTLTDLTGTLVKDNLINDLSSKLSIERLAREKDLSDPTINVDTGKTNLQEHQQAVAEVEEAALALQEEVDRNKENVARMLQQDSALDGIASVTNTLNGIQDEEAIALYKKTINPNLLNTAEKLQPLMAVTVDTPDAGEAPT